mgnify:CR=1 FL=1
METINPITLDKAIELVPAINATSAAHNVSDRYQFVSTRSILEKVQEYGWQITNATAQGSSPFAQHRVTLVHENDFRKPEAHKEGIPRIEMFNSHNRTKRLMFAIGFFRFVCSNGLIVASGPMETIRTKHRFSGDRLSVIMEQVSQISSRFPKILSKIEDFRSRQLNENEQKAYAEYAIRGRFNYRPEMPKRFQDVNRVSEHLLDSRREEDNGNSAWQVYNRVQENLIRGVEGFTRPIRGYSDSVRVNQLLWKGAEATLDFQSEGLSKALTQLLVKDGKKGKIAA